MHSLQASATRTGCVSSCRGTLIYLPRCYKPVDQYHSYGTGKLNRSLPRSIQPSATQSQSPTETQMPEWAAPGYRGAWVSSLPKSSQAALFAAIAVFLGAGTAFTASVAGPYMSAHLPSFLQVTKTSWFPLGPIFVAAGIAHFTEKQGFVDMYPHRGAWGIWYLPGSPTFHVYWTGVAEILGGLGLMLGALPFDAIPAWLSPASAFGLFLLTIVVTPANIYMCTHNAPGPLPKDQMVPWQGHVARGFMQAVLLSALWGIATASQ